MPSGEILEFLSLPKEPGIPAHNLVLKVGCLCAIMRNLSIEDGLVKNARVVVRELHERFVGVELLPNSSYIARGKVYCLPRIIFEFQPKYCPWTVQRRQFPLRLAYSTTFNSCQGLTLNRAVIDLRTPVFTHGQLYTSISRVRHRDHIRCFFGGQESGNLGKKTTNIVYKELLL